MLPEYDFTGGVRGQSALPTNPDDWKSRLQKQSPPARTNLKIGFQI